MAQEVQDDILLVEANIAERVSSFALDIGASLAKIVYRSKKDYINGKAIFEQGDSNVGRLRLAMMHRLKPEALIQFILDNVDRPDATSTPCTVPATGCGSSIYGQLLEQALNIKIQQIPEWDGFAAGLLFLQENSSRQSLCLETSAAGEADAMEKITTYMKIVANLQKFSKMKIRDAGASSGEDKQKGSTPSATPPETPQSPTDSDEQKTPVANAQTSLLTIIGSSTGWLQLDVTGSITALEMSATAGCTFVGLGRLLTRSSKTFLELIDLAKQGDRTQVDICGNELMSETKQDDVYSAIASDLSICYFGKLLTNPEGKFKDADLIASLLDTICGELVRTTRLLARANGYEAVYIAGNFVSNHHVRRVMTRDIIVGKLMSKQQNAPDIRFLRHGGYLGAIGTIMVAAGKTAKK